MEKSDKELILRVLKRDGEIVNFDGNKIFNAILKAFNKLNYLDSSNKENIEKVLNDIENIVDNIENDLIEEEQILTGVDYIQEIVKDELLDTDYNDVAKEYISYSARKDLKREESRDVRKSIDKVSNNDPNVVNENANKDSRKMATKRDMIAGQVFRSDGLGMLPKRVRNNHIKGNIYFHDLDYSPYFPYSNCCLVNIEDMLKNGYELNNTSIESPKSFEVAVSQMAMIVAGVTTSQYGGTSLPFVDEVLEPYAEMTYNKIYKEKLFEASELGLDLSDTSVINKLKELSMEKLDKVIYDAMQGFEYNINSMSGHGSQQPFVTVGFGRGTSEYSRMVQKAILKVRKEGLKDGKTAIFPKLVFFIEDGINHKKGDINYDIKQLALETSVKRMYPDIINVPMLRKITGTVAVPMGCRSFVPYWEDENGIETVVGRQNAGVVSLNLPRIALESNGSLKKFWEIFEDRLDICHEALRFRLDTVLTASPTSAPVLYKDGALGRLKDTDNVDELYRNGRATLSLGYIGIYETVLQFYGNSWESDKDAKEFSINIVKYMREKCDEWSEEEGYKYSLYSTPSESMTSKLCDMDREKFGIVKDVTDKEYYTNSFHYDVRKNPTPFEKIDFEKDYPYYASGGFIH